jgi:hypothetical protein
LYLEISRKAKKATRLAEKFYARSLRNIAYEGQLIHGWYPGNEFIREEYPLPKETTSVRDFVHTDMFRDRNFPILLCIVIILPVSSIPRTFGMAAKTFAEIQSA